MHKFIHFYEARLKRWGVYIISTPLFMMAVIEAMNAVGRKFHMPFPCAIEAVESLLVITIYFGVSIVALERGHVKVDLLARKMPVSIQNLLALFANVLGALVFGSLTYGAWLVAANAVKIMEMRIGVYRFPLWPFKLLFAVGMTLFFIQLVINVIKLVYIRLGNEEYKKTEAGGGGAI